MEYNIFVNCNGDLCGYRSRAEAQQFFLTCMNCSEGSERDRYTTIFLELQDPEVKFASDHSSSIYSSSIDCELISQEDLKDIKKYFDLEDKDINYIQANYKLSRMSKRIFNSDMEKYNHDFEEYYKNQPEYNKHDKYYLIDKNDERIVCFDNSASEYFCEEFSLKDYDYAYKWLNNEIEYDEYLNRDKEDMEI